MTINAARGRRLIKQDGFVGNGANTCVAGGAAHIFVSSLQGERGLLMIEQGRPPLSAGVALGAASDVRLSELPCMNVRVTLFA